MEDRLCGAEFPGRKRPVCPRVRTMNVPRPTEPVSSPQPPSGPVTVFGQKGHSKKINRPERPEKGRLANSETDLIPRFGRFWPFRGILSQPLYGPGTRHPGYSNYSSSSVMAAEPVPSHTRLPLLPRPLRGSWKLNRLMNRSMNRSMNRAGTGLNRPVQPERGRCSWVTDDARPSSAAHDNIT